MKTLFNSLCIIGCLFVIAWLLASFIDVNLSNDFSSTSTFADWNFFSLLQSIIKE